MKTLLIMGSVLAGLAVVAGAFGTHGLKSKITPEDIAVFETAVKYQMYHALALLIIGLMGFNFSPIVIKWPAILMSVGVLIFSGSLYAIVLGGIRWMGAVTPLGGILLIVSWLLLAYNIYKSS